MTPIRNIKNALFVAVLTAAAAFGSAAYGAQATTNVNVRSGPGTSYGVVDVLRTGEEARIVRTSGGWCQVTKAGPDGWVSCRYLTDDDSDSRRSVSVQPDVSVSFSVPGFSFFIGDPGGFDRPIRRDRRDRVCFYEHVGFEGERFCMRPGESRRSLGAWNDRISSIRVIGDAEALVCEHNRFNGRCAVIDRNIRNLGRRGNDLISSIRVR